MSDLTFNELAFANVNRAYYWNTTGKDLPLSFAILELVGEAGELANAAKKFLRHEHGLIAGAVNDTQPIVDELADVVICASLVARKLGINLGDAVVAKFNQTSAKYGFPVTL